MFSASDKEVVLDAPGSRYFGRKDLTFSEEKFLLQKLMMTRRVKRSVYDGGKVRAMMKHWNNLVDALTYHICEVSALRWDMLSSYDGRRGLCSVG